jgi:site-specific DNA-methyltransferase (adenine-specific)
MQLRCPASHIGSGRWLRADQYAYRVGASHQDQHQEGAAVKPRVITCADNIDAMERLADCSVDLVYMDPPFNSGRTYGLHMSGRGVDGRDGVAPAFSDASWSIGLSERGSSQAIGPRRAAWVSRILEAIPHPGMRGYLEMMVPRLVHAWRVLSETGSLFLHCDPTASHYLKVVLDAIFGPERFLNEVVWRRTHAHSSARRFAPVHDVLFFYAKGPRPRWNSPTVPYSDDYIEKYFRHEDERGRYQLITCTGPGDRTGTRAHYPWRGKWPPPGRHWAWMRDEMERLERDGLLVHSPTGVPRRKHYVSDRPGVRVADVWDDLPRLDTHATERVGFDTQKPIALLGRIIAATTPADGIVLDPFAGSGTTAVAAERLGRRWILVDSSLAACALSLGRVRQENGRAAIRLEGFPAALEAALDLRGRDPGSFALWGTSIVGTLHDRRHSDDHTASGRGVDAGDGGAVRSWVPLTAEPARTRVDVAPNATHLVLEHAPGDPLPEPYRGARLVRLAACVDRAARERGLAAA